MNGILQFKIIQMSYGRIKEKKLSENDYIMSCQQVRQELADSINNQAKRINIDSAKKLAVLQRFDYDGFRQMVLGANIFPTKTKQLYKFTKGLDYTGPKQQDENLETDEKSNREKIKQQISIRQVQGKSQLHCISFREFKKKFSLYYTQQEDLDKTLQCYKQELKNCSLIKEQNEERLSKIFNSECQGNILLKIVDVFSKVIQEMRSKETEGLQSETGYILKFFQTIFSIPTMKSVTLMILMKKQKQRISDFIVSLKQILPDEVQQINNIADMIKSK